MQHIDKLSRFVWVSLCEHLHNTFCIGFCIVKCVHVYRVQGFCIVIFGNMFTCIYAKFNICKTLPEIDKLTLFHDCTGGNQESVNHLTFERQQMNSNKYEILFVLLLFVCFCCWGGLCVEEKRNWNICQSADLVLKYFKSTKIQRTWNRNSQ